MSGLIQSFSGLASRAVPLRAWDVSLLLLAVVEEEQAMSNVEIITWVLIGGVVFAVALRRAWHERSK